MRRAAAKCLDAVVSTRHEMLPEFYKTVSPALIARFKEREENVKADVFHAYLSLLKQTRPVQSWLCDPDAMEQGDTPLTMLQSQVSVCSCAESRHQQRCSTTCSQGETRVQGHLGKLKANGFHIIWKPLAVVNHYL